MGTAAAVDADDIDGRGLEDSRRGRRRRPVGELELLAERHLGDDRVVVGRLARLVDREEQVSEVDERLDHEQVDAALEEAVDLLAEGSADRLVVEVEELRVGVPSGPIEPATSASRPTTSRASRATWAARRFRRLVWGASPKAASRTRFAPNVAVSMISAPAAR